MTKPITITGRDIIEINGRDNTGALAELGVAFIPRTDGYFDNEVADLTFQVDLDFVLRHGLLDQHISDAHYKGTPEYLCYYNEGRDAFLAQEGNEADNPHDTGTIADPDYWTQSIYRKRYPWYEGYRETQSRVMDERYRLKEMQDKIRTIVAAHGCQIDYTDEYGTPYVKTPEGYVIELA